MSDDVRNLHTRVTELTVRVNQLNAEKLYAENQTKTWKRLYFWTVSSTAMFHQADLAQLVEQPPCKR